MEKSKIEQDIEREIEQHMARRRASNLTHPEESLSSPTAAAGRSVRAPPFPRWDPHHQAPGQRAEPRRTRSRSPQRPRAAAAPESVVDGQFRPIELAAPDNIPLNNHLKAPVQPTFPGGRIVDDAYLANIDPRLWPASARQRAGRADEHSERVQGTLRDEDEDEDENGVGAILFPNLNWGSHNVHNEDGSFNVHPPHGDYSVPHLLGRVAPPQQPTAAAAVGVIRRDAAAEREDLAALLRADTGLAIEGDNEPQLEDVTWDDG